MSKKIDFDQIPPSLWDSGSYNWFNLEIRLSKTTEKELISKKESCSGFPALVHEFTHYLQNYSTAYGFLVFTTYVDCFNYFFVKNWESGGNIVLPLKGNLVDKELGHKNLDNFYASVYLGVNRNSIGGVLFHSAGRAEPDFKLERKEILNLYRNVNVEIYEMFYNGLLI